MKESIKIFENAQFGQIRTSVSESGEPLFCLADVCKALDINGGAGNVKSRLSAKGIVTINTPTNGGVQQLNFINEPNLYKCIFQSRKKEAEAFQDWVCNEVLPSIRQTGGYLATSGTDTSEEILAKAVLVAQKTIEKKEQRIKQLEHDAAAQAKQLTEQGATNRLPCSAHCLINLMRYFPLLKLPLSARK